MIFIALSLFSLLLGLLVLLAAHACLSVTKEVDTLLARERDGKHSDVRKTRPFCEIELGGNIPHPRRAWSWYCQKLNCLALWIQECMKLGPEPKSRTSFISSWITATAVFDKNKKELLMMKNVSFVCCNITRHTSHAPFSSHATDQISVGVGYFPIHADKARSLITNSCRKHSSQQMSHASPHLCVKHGHA